jgi:membrane-associated PAP2 superfamily phosphatase
MLCNLERIIFYVCGLIDIQIKSFIYKQNLFETKVKRKVMKKLIITISILFLTYMKLEYLNQCLFDVAACPEAFFVVKLTS